MNGGNGATRIDFSDNNIANEGGVIFMHSIITISNKHSITLDNL